MGRAKKVVEEAKVEEEPFAPFLTAFDPSDLPGTSIDPLGFDRGYTLFADKILPGITNVGRRPRYFSLLCAGLTLANVEVQAPERQQYERRLQPLLRLERLWVLSNLLASDEETLSSRAGVRGALYGMAHLERLEKRGANRTGTDFQLLLRQVPYGVIGIYANVASGMRMLDRKTLALTPALGGKLGTAFLDETEIPTSVWRAAVDPASEVTLATLKDWGTRAHIEGGTGEIEASCLGEALHADPTRSRMATLLDSHPADDGDSELARLARIQVALSDSGGDEDLAEALRAILPFEECFRLALLAFERLLWCAKASPTHAFPEAECRTDPVLQKCAAAFPAAVSAFEGALEAGCTPEFRKDHQRLADLRRFFSVASTATDDALAFTRAVVDRHAQVQRGKLDRGRPKLPFIEVKAGAYSLTLARVGELASEPVNLSQVSPHEYRTATADALLSASRGSRP